MAEQLNHGIETSKKEIIRAQSLQHFVELVEALSCKRVEAKPTFTIESREVRLKDGGTVTRDNYVFITEYSSESSGDKNIQYKEHHSGGFYTQTEFERGVAGDELLRAINIARGIITTDERLKKIKERLPNIDIEGPLSKMHYSDKAKLANLTITHNINPFDFSALEDFNRARQ